jgi:hypothetical protein
MTDPRTTFDVSTANGELTELPDANRHYAAAAQAYDPGVADEHDDTLELLRQRAGETVEVRSTTVYTPTEHIRLVCRGNIDGREIQRWNRKALPPVARKASNPSAFDADSRVLYSTVLSETCERVEVLGRTGEWRVVEDAVEHTALTFKDPALLNAFGSLEATGAIKKMFVLDSAITKAGQAVLEGAGWAEGSTGFEADDDLDPTA